MEIEKDIWNSANCWNSSSGGRALFRGFSRPSDGTMIVVQSPSKRPPLDIDPITQIKIDDWFFKQFGIRFRERSLFATGDFKMARTYAKDFGQVRRLVPKENFCFCWSPECEDLYTELKLASKAESIDHLMDRLKFQCYGIEEAILSGHEIMLVCSAVEATLISHS